MVRATLLGSPQSSNLLQAIESKKKLALAIVDFLNSSTTDGTLSSDEKESIEVATQCIADAFKIDIDDKAAMTDALGGQSLLAIYNVFEKMKGKTGPKPAPAAASPAPAAAAGPKKPTDAEKAEAEALKSKGNAAMAVRDFPTAIDFYTQALKIVPNNPIYLSNRAAAHSNVSDFDSAIADAEIAVDTDPSYSKGWSRLGHARYSKGDNRGAMEAYKAGIDASGETPSNLLKIGYETAKKRFEQEENVERSATPAARGAGGAGGMPDLSALAGGLGDMGGLEEMMKNPMLSAAMEQMKNNPKMMEDIMNSDMLKNMLGGGGAGGAGGLGAMMSNPQFASM